MLSLLACAPLPIKAPDRQLSYTILMNGQKAGYEIDKFSPDGTVQCDYTFNDRGRGPTVAATYVFGSSGLPTQVQIKGVNYYKANVSEHFELADGNSRWDSKLEHGQGKNGFYISNDGSNSFEMASLARCLLKSHDHRISLLPAGEAQLQKVASATVRLNRQSMRVTEYAISGLYFSPSEIWVDQNGD